MYNDNLFKTDLNKLCELIEELSNVLMLNAERSKGLELCYERCVQLKQDCAIFLNNTVDKLNVKWYEVYKHNFILNKINNV